MDTGVFAFASSTNLQTFTPVRRRQSTINTRLFNADPEKEWTTARCHRLLRALTSRVAILKKEISRFAQPGKDTETETATTSRTGDADWTQARKRIRRTYSSRGAKATSKGPKKPKGRKSYLPGEVLVPTPLLARARGEQPDEPARIAVSEELAPVKTKRRRTRYTMGVPEGEFQLTKPLRELRQDITAIRYTTYEGIYSGLETLLRATEQDKPETKRKGARSLSSMALRAIPRYVTEQEALLEAHMQETGSKSAIQSRDIATEIYDELESFGTSGYGWPQLRIVIRSHGIGVLHDAIRAGLFDVDFCGVLVSLCIHNSALDEAQSLVSALVSSTQYPQPKTLYDPLSRPVIMLCKFAQHSGHLSFQYRQLAYIISSKSIPIDWLAAKDFGSIWTEAIQLSRSELDNEDALTFLESSLAALALSAEGASMTSHGMVEAVGNTLSSLLTTFVSIIILSKETEDQQELEASTQQHNQFITLLRNCLFAYQHANVKMSSKSILLLLASMFTDQERSGLWEPGSDMVEILLTHLEQNGDDFAAISSTYSDSVMFICQVARCCGRGASNFGFEYLEHMHLILKNLVCGRAGTNVLMGLIVDSAFTFAQKVPDRKHLDYAADMDAMYCTRGFNTEASLHNIPVTNDDNENSGFRWEEGISEWVTATPTAEHTKQSLAMDPMSADDWECDTPYRPPQHLRRQIELEPIITTLVSSSPSYSQAQDKSSDTYPDVVSSPGPSSLTNVIEISSNDEQSAMDSSTIESEDELAETSLQSMDSSVVAETNVGAADTSLQDMDTSAVTETDDEIELSFTEESLFSMESPSLLKTSLASNHATVYRAPRLNRKIFGKSDDWQVFDESFDSTTSSLASNVSSEFSGPSREFIDRAPRLGRKAIQGSEAWQLFDESDDELSFLSVSSQGEALQDVTKTSVNNARRPRQAKPSVIQSKSKAGSKRIVAPSSDSEDELCI
jgi:hypothetical protein